MFELFTDRARDILSAVRNPPDHPDRIEFVSDRILFAILNEPQCTAFTALNRQGVDCEGLALKIKESRWHVVDSGSSMCPSLKSIVALSIEEAHCLKHNYVGTEHLLLGLLRMSNVIAMQKMGFEPIDIDVVRSRIREITDNSFKSDFIAPRFQSSCRLVSVEREESTGRITVNAVDLSSGQGRQFICSVWRLCPSGLMCGIPTATIIGCFAQSWSIFAIALFLVGLQNALWLALMTMDCVGIRTQSKEHSIPTHETNDE